MARYSWRSRPPRKTVLVPVCCCFGAIGLNDGRQDRRGAGGWRPAAGNGCDGAACLDAILSAGGRPGPPRVRRGNPDAGRHSGGKPPSCALRTPPCCSSAMHPYRLEAENLSLRRPPELPPAGAEPFPHGAGDRGITRAPSSGRLAVNLGTANGVRQRSGRAGPTKGTGGTDRPGGGAGCADPAADPDLNARIPVVLERSRYRAVLGGDKHRPAEADPSAAGGRGDGRRPPGSSTPAMAHLFPARAACRVVQAVEDGVVPGPAVPGPDPAGICPDRRFPAVRRRRPADRDAGGASGDVDPCGSAWTWPPGTPRPGRSRCFVRAARRGYRSACPFYGPDRAGPRADAVYYWTVHRPDLVPFLAGSFSWPGRCMASSPGAAGAACRGAAVVPGAGDGASAVSSWGKFVLRAMVGVPDRGG